MAAMNEGLRRLPDIPILCNRCRAMEMLDAVLSPEWEVRYYSFNRGWGDSEEMASMFIGSGEDWFIVFSAAGVYVRGFDHEKLSGPGVIDAAPVAFGTYAVEPTVADHDGSTLATVCFWREPHDTNWGVSTAENGLGERPSVICCAAAVVGNAVRTRPGKSRNRGDRNSRARSKLARSSVVDMADGVPGAQKSKGTHRI
ncbi:hypothetical protein [Nocardia sp. NPDC003963]